MVRILCLNMIKLLSYTFYNIIRNRVSEIHELKYSGGSCPQTSFEPPPPPHTHRDLLLIFQEKTTGILQYDMDKYIAFNLYIPLSF